MYTLMYTVSSVYTSGYLLGLSLGLSLLMMGDGLFSSSGVVMLTGAAASSTSFSLGQDDSPLISSHTSWCSQNMASITGLLPFHNSPIIFIFVLLSCFQRSFVGFQGCMALFGS